MNLKSGFKYKWQCGDYEVIPSSMGFKPFTNRMGYVASFIAHRDGLVIGFAFAFSSLSVAFSETIKLPELEQKVIKVIEEKLGSGDLKDREEYAFFFSNHEFNELKDPDWWVKSSS